MTLMTNDGTIPQLTLGLRLELARRSIGLTQSAFAPLLGISNRTIQAFEADTRPPKKRDLMAWAQATGVSLKWLETGIAAVPDGDGGNVIALPRLDSNQQPSGYRPRLLRVAA